MAAFSSFIILPSAFEMSLVTGLRAERYDQAGLGCYGEDVFERTVMGGVRPMWQLTSHTNSQWESAHG